MNKLIVKLANLRLSNVVMGIGLIFIGASLFESPGLPFNEFSGFVAATCGILLIVKRMLG